MTRRCLNERRLVEAAGSECTSEERAHLESCGDCAGRSATLRRDLALIGAALQTPPSWRPMQRAAWRPAPGWAMAAGGVLLVTGVLLGSWLVRPAPISVERAALTPRGFAIELSQALAAGDEELDVAAGEMLAVHGVRTALSGRWPCATAGARATECDDELTALVSTLVD